MINEWKGDDQATASIVDIEITQAIEGLLYEARFADEPPALVRASAGQSRADIAALLAAQLRPWRSWSIAHTAGASRIRLTSTTRGIPASRGLGTGHPASSYVERMQAGLLPVPQEFLVTLPAATTGGTWDLSLDFGGGPEIASGLSATITPAALAAAINALDTPTALGGGATVTLISTTPRSYRVRLGGGLATGTEVTITASGDDLTGNARAEVRTIQSTAPNAQEIQAVWLAGVMGLNAGVFTDLRFSANGGATWSAWSTQEISAWSSSAAVVPHLRSLIGSVYGVTPDIWIRGGDGSGTGGNFGIVIRFPGTIARTPIQCQVRVSGLDLPTVATQRLQEGGGASANEFQLIYAVEPYTLNFVAQETDSIGLGEGNALITAKLEALASIGSGEVMVHRGATSPSFVSAAYVVEFRAGLGAANQPAITSDTAQITTIADGQAMVNEQQAITLHATGGTWTITDVDAEDTTDPLAFGASAATVQSALWLVADEDYLVSGAGTIADPYIVEFTDDKSQTDVSLLVVDVSSLTGGADPTLDTIVMPLPGVNEIQRLRIDPRAEGGTLRVSGHGGHSPDVDHDADAEDWGTALETLFGGSNIATDGDPGDILIEFVAAWGWRPVPLLTLDQDGLELADWTATTRDIIALGSGPTDFTNGANWTLGHVPDSGETIVFGSGRQPCLHGLRQRASFTVEIPEGDDFTRALSISECDLSDNQIVRLRTTGTFPSAEDADEQAIVIDGETDYHIVGIDHVGGTLVLAETAGGPAIHWTGAGTGTHVVEVQAAAISQFGRHSGPIGLPRRTTGGSFEWRPRYLEIGLLPPEGAADNLLIGQGPGPHSSRLQLDLRGSQVRALIMQTGQSQEVPPCLLLIDHPLAELHVVDGDVGIAIEPGETSRLGRINSYGGRTRLGRVTATRLGNFNGGIEFIRAAAEADEVQTDT